MTTAAGDHWRAQLEGWAIPREILERAEASPWHLPPGCFALSANPPTPTTTDRCLQALDGGTVLDVGIGGGRASLHLGASTVIGVDARPAMLDRAVEEASRTGAHLMPVLGEWPDVADQAPHADVVVCSHVAYNVQQIEAFLTALHEHATRRVVLEVDASHPMTRTRPAWRTFWGIDRPIGPSWEDLAQVLRDLGIEPLSEDYLVPAHKGAVTDDEVVRLRTRLCLSPDRDQEVRAFLEATPRTPRHVVTLWWDTA
ncbi:MAG: methyltransferase domain-containing protein [Acidimicrobiia bacterium]|nr:MAG: methyltransferase domain-containing protein [Acidimicrobiia bacterium]